MNEENATVPDARADEQAEGPPAAPLAAEKRCVWPYVMGGISMVLAGYSLLAMVSILLQLVYSALTGRLARTGSLFPFGGTASTWELVRMARYGLRPMLGAILLAGGFTLYRHNRFGPLLHVIYAVPAVPLTVGLAIADTLTCPPSVMPQMAVWTIWDATTSLIYPVFVLVWFARPQIRRQVRAWR